MRIDCEVHVFRRESRRAVPVIDGSLQQLEDAARDCAVTGLVLVQPAFLNDDPTELFAQASRVRMPVRLIPPLVQPLEPEVLEAWGRSGAAGLAVTFDDPDPLAESFETALQLGLHLEVSGGIEGREPLAELLLADGHRLVFRGFGLADNARDPAWDPRLERLLALAKGAEVWVKLSGIGRVPDAWAQAAAGRMLEELGPKQLLWGSEWPHVAAAHAYVPSYAQAFEWLEELVPDEDARGRILGETPAALYRLSVS
ncbi:amidohydrolase family protein [Bradyrhizobium xenonodulans]|uniref:Amidohydrolase family protein n=1 Tax=Bradyrhizobium xenonodulans TaxID=2736875 RepID=A0ABY7MHH6_9BRAD|nr:amidohydrolase family protein [Bradyrhizobium xenonodulans]WBL77842.1 amidohydrolase family protein [Bradyrhizobium xenonodulans]